MPILQEQLNAGAILRHRNESRDAVYKPESRLWFQCHVCHVTKPCGVGVGYGCDADGNLVCYACCGDNDARALRDTGRAVLYLTWRSDTGRGGASRAYVSNWPGTLRLPVYASRKGRHNLARTRYDVWFRFEGREYHGVQLGEWSDICRVRRVKG